MGVFGVISSVFLSSGFPGNELFCEGIVSVFKNCTFEAVSCPAYDALGRVVEINGCGTHRFASCQWRLGDVARNDTMLHYFYSIHLQSFFGVLDIADSVYSTPTSDKMDLRSTLSSQQEKYLSLIQFFITILLIEELFICMRKL